MTVNLSTIHPLYNGNHDEGFLGLAYPSGPGSGVIFSVICTRLAGKKDPPAHPIRGVPV
jgi:hypothetical protein